MKVTGIELSQMIKNEKLEDETIIKNPYCSTMIYKDKKLCWEDSKQEVAVRYLTTDSCSNSFYIYKHLLIPIEESKNYEFEKIEKLGFIYNNTYGNRSQHRKSEEPLINAINQLIKNQEKIIDKINKKNNPGDD